MAFIDVTNLTKTFTVRKKQDGSFLRKKTQFTALDSVSFSVEKGELVGYIGPNGAGKSTTVKLLSGILTPEGGEARVGCFVPWKERREYVRHIGVVFGQRTQLWWDVPVADSYLLLRDIYKLSEVEYRRRLDELVTALDLSELLGTPLRLLSLGQRMRVELAGSLLHRPELLFLDEPTIGLDAVSKLTLRDFLKHENAQYGTTIMLTTHDMEDIAALCARVLVLGHGKKLYDGRLEELLTRYDTLRVVKVRYDGAALPAMPDCCTVAQVADGYQITYRPEKMPTDRLLTLLQSAGTIREMTVQPRNTDQMIADMYRELQL